MSEDWDAIDAAIDRVQGIRDRAYWIGIPVYGGAALAAFAVAFLLANIPWVWLLSLPVALIGLGYLNALFSGIGADMRALFKRELMPHVLAQVDPGLRHDSQGISGKEFCAAALFDEPTHVESKDTVSGRIGEIPFRFAMVRATRKRDRDEDLCFEGLFLVADFNKNFRGRTRVRAGGAGFIGQFDDAYVAFEDARFAKAFAVDSTDQIEARYLLTPDLCERLVALTERHRPVAALFDGGNMTLALGMAYDALDSEWGAGFDRVQFDRLVEKHNEIASLAEHLELDTRIWSKV
jgi:hypothetical protein